MFHAICLPCLYSKYEEGKGMFWIWSDVTIKPLPSRILWHVADLVTLLLYYWSLSKLSQANLQNSNLSHLLLTVAVYLVLCSIFSRSFFCLTLWEIHCPKVTKTNDIPPKKHILIDAINFTAKGKFKDKTSRADEVGEGKWVCSGRRWKEVTQWSSDDTVYSWQTYWNINWPNLLNWPNLFT